MKRLYLASSIDRTAENIAKDIRKKNLRLAFITTASEVEEGDKDWLENDRLGLKKAGFDLLDYTITGKSLEDIEKDLGEVDVVHVNGGNTFYLLLQVKKSGFDKWIKRVVSKGKIYTGSSAGSLLTCPSIKYVEYLDDKSKAKGLTDFRGLGIVDFSLLVHWGSKFNPEGRLKTLKELYKSDEWHKLILLNDWQYVKVVGDMYRIIDIRD